MKIIENSTVITKSDDLDSEIFKKTYSVFRLDKMLRAKPRDYSGIFYSNSFKVDKPISLISAGFYGPYWDQNTMYQVEIQIEGLPRWNENPSKIINRTKVGIRAEKGKSIMYAKFSDPVRIQPNIWYTIKFQLDGPPTFRGVNNYHRMVELPEEEQVNFEFFRGSQQMPCLQYSLL